MKNLRFFLPIVIAVISAVLFSQCKKDHSCNMSVTCYYSSNGIDADSVVPNAIITFDTIKYTNGLIDPDITLVHLDSLDRFSIDSIYSICNIEGLYKYKTNKFGVFNYTLKYPALLIVNAIKVDAVWDTNTNQIVDYVKYTGTAQVQLNEGETTEKRILLVETN